MHDAQVYAYMSLDSVDSKMGELILEARKEIIFSTSWSVDGVDMYINRQDGTTERVPKFSELFPEWDIPTMDSDVGTLNDFDVGLMRAESTAYQVYLRNPSTMVDTAPFTAFEQNGTYVKTTVSTLSASEHCNIGYSNRATGASYGYAAALKPGESVTLLTATYGTFICAVRASTNSNPGYGVFVVEHDNFVSVR